MKKKQNNHFIYYVIGWFLFILFYSITIFRDINSFDIELFVSKFQIKYVVWYIILSTVIYFCKRFLINRN